MFKIYNSLFNLKSNLTFNLLFNLKFNYLKIFNRWGQLLFNTIDANRGWDGTANGVQQPSGTYVFITEGIDFLGKSVFRKGTIVLIR